MLGDKAARRSDVRGIKSRKTGIAAEDAKDADAFVGAEDGSLPRDVLFTASDRRGKADAVFGALNIVVHRLRDGDERHAGPVQNGGEAERVVAADGDKTADLEPLEIPHDNRG